MIHDKSRSYAEGYAAGKEASHSEVLLRELARKKWASSAPIPTDSEHPARRWLAARHLGRPAADGGVNVAEGLDGRPSTGGRGGFFDVDLARWLPSLSAVDVWPTLDEAGGPFAPLDAAAVESSAADLERGGLPTWEARRLASVILGQVLHLADGTLHATREGIPRPAPAGSSPLSDRIGPKPPFLRSTAKTRRAERPVAAFSRRGGV